LGIAYTNNSTTTKNQFARLTEPSPNLQDPRMNHESVMSAPDKLLANRQL